MARTTPLTAAERFRIVAYELLDTADQHEIPSRSTVRAEMLIGRAEAAAADVRAIVRGRR